MNHFHAAGGIALPRSHTLLEPACCTTTSAPSSGRGLWRYTPSRARRRRARLGGGPRRPPSTPRCCAPRTTRSPPTVGCGCSPGRSAARSSRPPRSSPSTGSSPRRRVVFDDQDDFLEAFAGRRARRPRLRRGDPLPGPGRERHARAAQAHARRSACCRTAASGSRSSPTAGCPARRARSPPRSTSPPRPPLGGPLARVHDGDLITVDADAGLLDLARRPTPTFAARPTTGRAPHGAEWAGTGRELFAAFRATVGPAETGASVFPGSRPRRRSPLSSTSETAHCSPSSRSCRSSSSTTSRTRSRSRGPWSRAACRSIELTLRTPVALDAIRAIAAEVPEILVGAGTVVDPGQAKQAARRGRAVPGLARHDAGPCCTAMHDTGLPFLPGTATVSEVLAVLEAGFTEMKFFPAEAVRRCGVTSPSIASPVPARPVLPDRRHHRRERRLVPRPAERRLRRRLVAHAGQCCRSPGLGVRHRPGC